MIEKKILVMLFVVFDIWETYMYRAEKASL